MRTLSPDSADARRIDAALAAWRQGDLALDERWFVHVGEPSVPLSDAAAMAPSDQGMQALTSEVAGLAMLTQTCDVVRSCVTRPFVEVAPLVALKKDDLVAVKRGRRPALATLPALEEDSLAVDLDRVMTVEKSIVATWARTPGYSDDADGRAFARALARKRARFAFPDDFTQLVRKLQKRIEEKHDREALEGRALRALREIRVSAAPSWDAAHCTLTFFFVKSGDDVDFEGRSWSAFVESWLRLTPPSGRFVDIHGHVTALEDLRAADYVDSDPLDLDHLSSRDKE